MRTRTSILAALALLAAASACHRRVHEHDRNAPLTNTVVGEEPLYIPPTTTDPNAQPNHAPATHDPVGTTTTTGAEVTPTEPTASPRPGAERYSVIESPKVDDRTTARGGAGGAGGSAAETTPAPAATAEPPSPAPPPTPPSRGAGSDERERRVGPPSAADRVPWAGSTNPQR